jgi:hypothetical protein
LNPSSGPINPPLTLWTSSFSFFTVYLRPPFPVFDTRNGAPKILENDHAEEISLVIIIVTLVKQGTAGEQSTVERG